MNEEQVRRLMAGAASPALDDDVRAAAALFAGHQLVRTRRTRHWVLGATALAAVGVVVLIPRPSAPATDVVLGCAQGVGTAGAGLVTGGIDGVTLAVDNPTREVLTVTGGTSSVMALPGTTQVTLPVATGQTVRCGSGAPVRLTVQEATRSGSCASVLTAAAATVENGEISALTRSQLSGLPQGSVVDASDDSTPLRRVQVRAAGKVVAEALWHELPGGGDWQLESVSRCG
ncbi:MAG: hypothetical protein JWO22_3212 [Frankiales bacterium]|nr:hypothetical protein [Frankiales bacterium]